MPDLTRHQIANADSVARISGEPIALVAKVAAHLTFPLRQTVLRPEESLADMARADDGDPNSGHFAAYADGQIVGAGTVRRKGSPWLPQETGFQIRGMAVSPEYRGQGIGSTVLGAIINHVAQRGGGLLWCRARIRAVGLYQRAGFQTVTELFVDDKAGEVVGMQRQVSSC